MKTRYKTALVTGGAGFIGSHLSETLVKQDFRVTIVDNLVNGRMENIEAIAGQVDFHLMDIRSLDFQDLLLTRNFDVIFHLAANAYVPPSIENPDYDFQLNLFAPFQLLETLRKAELRPIVIAASSAAVYGNPTHIPISEAEPTDPISPYGVSKLATERYLSVYSRVYGLRAAPLRFFSVYGPRQHKQIVYDFIKKIADNPEEMEILGDGSQVRDLVYVEDVVQSALVVLKKAPLRGEVYNVAAGRGYSTREIAEAITHILGVRSRFRFTGSIRPGDCEKWIASIDRIRSLGFSPRFSLEEGLQHTLAWYSATHPAREVGAHLQHV